MNEWSSPQLRRLAAEAVWDQQTYDKLVADWGPQHAGHATGREPSRARTHRPSNDGRVPARGTGTS